MNTITTKFSIMDKVGEFLIYFSILIVLKVKCEDSKFKIGTGISDITGPAAEINMMGYANLEQNTAGIHFRLYSRSIIIEDSSGNRVCFVTCDIGMISQILKLEVIKILEKKYRGIYTINNVMLTSTHTHSGPGGYLQYFLYSATSLGFVEENFKVIKEGIIKSIEQAHSNMIPGYIDINKGKLLDASINRSPTAYANNAESEKALYEYNTDKDMTVLKFTDNGGKNLAAICWFAVHATSMNNTNTLISGDNKGYASMLFERHINGGTIPGKGPFVALFPQSNSGDVSPNIDGPHCLDSGLECDLATSTCANKSQLCVGSGPGNNMFESTKIIGFRQYYKAKELFDTAFIRLSGNVSFIHQTVNMSSVEINFKDNVTVSICKPAMGYSFAAGTTDGPGFFDFYQGQTRQTLFGRIVRSAVRIPSQEIQMCHKPKTILFATGEMDVPYEWQPTILPTQIFKMGNLLIIAVPAEFTTMSGRRLQKAVKDEFDSHLKKSDVKVVMSGLANAYSSYVTTFEEYQVQRYEAASTIYGPYTLDAYIQQYKMLASNLATGHKIIPGPREPNLSNILLNYTIPVVFDLALPRNFGSVIVNSKKAYKRGSIVSVTFSSGHPRNNLKTDDTFLTVEKFNNNKWDVIATDGNFETKFIWKKTSMIGQSTATIEWDIPLETPPGSYRITHFGYYKNILQQIRSYNGSSLPFSVIP